jgi:3-hydroxyacyl-[acyl-carrier-protein] dehydratase
MAFDISKLPVDIGLIQRLLPHRYPFLLVDRVTELEPGVRIRALKNVTVNEPFFNGHFPGSPIMPGVLILEAMAQAGGLLTHLSAMQDGISTKEGKLFYLVKIDNARFSRMVVPGDQLILDVSLKRMMRNMALYCATATVDGVIAASADILCAEGK